MRLEFLGVPTIVGKVTEALKSSANPALNVPVPLSKIIGKFLCITFYKMQFEEGRKCLYEVLGVERFSTTDDIKKAYKRMALKFHPDKSPKGEEDAYKEKFQVINDAY